MAKDSNWRISIKAPFQGFAPSYWTNSYPLFGNSSMAADMQFCDVTDPNVLSQGTKSTALTNGTSGGAVTTMIVHALSRPTSDDVSFAVGGNLLYKFSSTAVTSAGSYPHTINKAVVTGEDTESIVYYNDYAYYFYNHSGSAGDIGRLTVSTDTFDDDWGSTVPATGATTLNDAPHPAIVGGDGVIYFGNGRYVGYYDPVNDVLSVDELDLPADVQVVDLVWERNFIYIATNSPNLSSGNTNEGRIYTWDTVSSSFQEPIIEVPGRLGSLFTKNGRIFVFYQDLSSTGGFKIGYIVGDTVQEIGGFSGTLPTFGQVAHYKNMIAFISEAEIYLWGAEDKNVPVALSSYGKIGDSNVGALCNPFGELLTGSNEGVNYKFARQTGITTSAIWKTISFDVASSKINKIIVWYEPTATGAAVDITLKSERGNNTYPSSGAMTITHTDDGSLVRKTFYPNVSCDDFRLELDWSNGSTTNALKIRRIDVVGNVQSKT